MQTTEPSSISSPEKSAQQQTPREEPKKREKHTLKLPQELGEDSTACGSATSQI